MKTFSLRKTALLVACLIMLPVAGFAAQKTAAPATHKNALVAACEGKKAGDAVTLMKKGKKVDAVCQDVKGTLKAVATKQKK